MSDKIASWLNQVECWFSLLAGQSLQGTSFTSVDELRRHIDAFIADYNHSARPFAWSKSEVHQKRFKARFADQRFWVLAQASEACCCSRHLAWAAAMRSALTRLDRRPERKALTFPGWPHLRLFVLLLILE